MKGRAMRRTVALLAIALAVGSHATAREPAAAADDLRVDLPYQAHRSNPVTHEIDFSVVITPPYHCQVLKVWLPVPTSDHAQQIGPAEISTFPVEVTPEIGIEPELGNKFAYFEFHHPLGAQIIRHRFTARVWDLHWDVEPEAVAAPAEWPAGFTPFLQPQPMVHQAGVDQVLAGIVSQPRRAASDLLSAMNWIDANLTYDHVHASLRADADHAFEQLRGHCSDYHGLCAAMGRQLGFPTRVTYGMSLFPKNSPSHCKMEAFLPPYGWVSFDLSETQKLIATIRDDAQRSPEEKDRLSRAARERLHRGFRENSWLLVTRGTDIGLVPPAAHPVPVVRTIYAEADGEPLPDPDPANIEKREFAWMTVHKYTADRPFALPFEDVSTLAPYGDAAGE